jgi:hypothetical protein
VLLFSHRSLAVFFYTQISREKADLELKLIDLKKQVRLEVDSCTAASGFPQLT